METSPQAGSHSFSQPVPLQVRPRCGTIEVVTQTDSGLEQTNTVQKSTASVLFSTYPLRFIPHNYGVHGENIAVTMLGFGGGLVSGDITHVQCSVKQAAAVCLKTVGSTKVFKTAANTVTRQRIDLAIEARALAISIPDPTTCYKDAAFAQHQAIDLQDASSSAVLVDWYTSGRKHLGEDWSARSLETVLDVKCANKTVFHEHNVIANTVYSSAAAKIGHAAIFGTLLLTGPRTERLRLRLAVLNVRQSFEDVSAAHNSNNKNNNNLLKVSSDIKKRKISETGKQLVSVAQLSSNLTVVRFAFDQMEAAVQFLAEALRPLNDELSECNAYSDRIHSGAYGDDWAERTSPYMALLRAFDEQERPNCGKQRCTVTSI